MPSTESMARVDILLVCARIWPAALLTRMSSGRLAQILSIIASTASATRTSPPADHHVGAELEIALRHRPAEPGAAAGHQDALALEQVGLKHRALPIS